MNTLTAPAHAQEGQRAFRLASVVLGYGIAPIMCVLIVAFLAWTEPRFFSRLNLMNVSRNFSLLSLAATGQALVMIAGGFDMSVGAAMALASIVQVSTMVWFTAHFPAQPAVMVCAAGVVAAALSGALLGLTNALIVTHLKVVPFMTTLAVTYVVVGGLLYYTKGVPLYGVPDGFTDFIGRGTLLSIPVITWIGLIVIGLVSVALTYSRTGRHIYAVGGHAPAARASGVAVERTLVICYVLSALCAALAGVLWTARLGTGESALGGNTAIESIAAAVLGGVSLRGGQGGIWRVTVAALFLTLVSNALNLLQIDSKWQTFVLGVAVIVAVFVELLARKESRDE